jgi:hypothetical protein
MSPSVEQLSIALSAIERAEQPLLSWGVVDGSMTEDEAIELLERAFPGEEGEELLEAMEFARLIRLLPDGRVRSRSAETVRLATTLRQWFHKKPWTSAPNLVSDYRFLSTPRGVPDRSATSIDDLVRQAGEIAGFGTDHERAMRAVLGGRSVSNFQARSTLRILGTSDLAASTGTVISAGTGAGKTLAFYLPALTKLIAEGSPGRHPQIVAIYPRKELLRDQLASLMETFAGLRANGVHTPSVGALYGATPLSRKTAVEYGGWRRSADSLISPILACPVCKGDLLWPESRNELVCADCTRILTNDDFRLTRDQIQQRSPDILFTTTEMVNRNIGNPAMKRLFAGDRQSGPQFVLFDEIHTYSGMHGAQVANLVRRWRDEAKHPTAYVGLSATLADPVGFFSDLTGLSSSEVVVVAPEEAEIAEASRDYLLVLRGDPVSQTSLLSTTIQTTMLIRRMLDRAVDVPSRGLFGSKVFAFTDDLDVVNRLHYQLQDAEGWKSNGIDQKPNGSLALLRDTGEEARDREDAGQLWELARLIGTLQQPNRIARTTSQDSGVDPNANTVVATASLEVGFDDPAVGAVVQHKAPRDSAQFIQRRGRAGRNPIMRPWTAVVLSDYGRDRLAFQGYEALASPVVLPTRMPTKNRALLKIQGAWILLDLIQGECGLRTLKYAAKGETDGNRDDARRALAVVRKYMTPAGLERLTWAIRRKLGIDEELARTVVWDPPRALATAVLPTLHRLLSTATNGHDATRSRDPLYEFVPAALFSSLLTPEVILRAAKKFHPDEDDEFQEPISSALRAFAPGRISFRYALHGRSTRLWLAPPASDAASLDLSGSIEQADDLPVPGNEEITRLLHPVEIRLSTPPVDVPDMAYGTLNWKLAIERTGEPLELDVPSRSIWSEAVVSAEAFAHRFGSPLQVTRYATEITVDRRTESDPHPTTHGLTYELEAAGVGFINDVDGLRVVLRIEPHDFEDESGLSLLRALRPAWFEHLALTDPDFVELVPSKFHREWLSQLMISALTSAAVSQNLTLEETERAWSDNDLRVGLRSAAQKVFGSLTVDTDSGDLQPDGLLGEIDSHVATDAVGRWLSENACALWATGDGPDFRSWVAERFLVTVGAGLVQAAQTVCPEHDSNELRIETATEESGAIGTIHLLEDEPGGSGLVETLIERYIDDPRAFWLLVSASLTGGPGERTDSTLRSLLAVRTEPGVRRAADEIRSAVDLRELTSAWSRMRSEMYGRGLASDPTVVSALATRLFKAGSSLETEDLVEDLLHRWDHAELALGVELELRVFAFLCSNDGETIQILESVVGGGARDTDWALNQIVGLLWNRGARVRAAALQVYNPYTNLQQTERLLADKMASRKIVEVRLSGRNWRGEVDEELARAGSVALVGESVADFGAALADLLVRPTFLGSLETFPRVVAVRRTHLRSEAIIELRELVQ